MIVHSDSQSRTHCRFAEHCPWKAKTLCIWSHGLVSASFLRGGITHDLLGQTEAEQKVRGQRKQLRGLPRNLAPVGGVILHRQREHPAKTPPPADRYICHQGNRRLSFFLFNPTQTHWKNVAVATFLLNYITLFLGETSSGWLKACSIFSKTDEHELVKILLVVVCIVALRKLNVQWVVLKG